MARYCTLADVTDEDLQNVQEWAKTWGHIEHGIQRFGGDVVSAYAVLGEHDFQFTYDAPGPEGG